MSAERPQPGTRRAQSGHGAAEPRPRRPAQLPCTTPTGAPHTATHGGGPSATVRATAWATPLSWSRPAACWELVMVPSMGS